MVKFLTAARGRGYHPPVAGKAALGLSLLILALASCQPSGDGSTSSPVKNIILFIADGMQLENEIATSRYLSGVDRGLVWHSFPYQGYVATWDVSTYNTLASDRSAPPYDEAGFDPIIGYDPALGGSAPYPISSTGSMPYFLRAACDSASSSTAMATGVKTDRGNISWLRNDPAGGALATIAELIRAQKGASIGVVTTVPFNHATPAGFTSHNTERYNYEQIADEIIDVTTPEVVIGAGHPSWNGDYFSGSQLDALRASGVYSLVERVSGQDGGINLMAAAASLAAGKKLFGLFGGAGGNMEPPVPRDRPGNPGFVQEGENPSLALSTKAALMVVASKRRGFFLMVEGGDIDWANSANDFAGMVGTVWSLNEAVAAAVEYVDKPGDSIDWTNTLLIVTCDHATGGLRLNDSLPSGKGDLPDPDGYLYETRDHTNELVTLYAKGAHWEMFRQREGASYPGTKILDNTQIFQTMAEAAGLR